MNPLLTPSFDAMFDHVQGLTWLPWIGANYPARSQKEKLLIVGESHYTKEGGDQNVAASVAKLMKNRDYTREIVEECCIDQDWPNRTLDNLHLMLAGGATMNRQAFWGDSCFYNFVQRPMDYARRERPQFDDFAQGWNVFLEVARILKPSRCLFIGVAASNCFNYCMETAAAKFEASKWTEQVGRTWGRAAKLTIDGSLLHLDFIQHAGNYFSWEGWNAYLTRNCADLISLVNDLRYLESTTG